MRQRRGIARRPRRPPGPEWRERFGRDDPRRNERRQAFRQERTQWLRFPRLDVACGPVIQQTESSDMPRRLGDWDRGSQRVARPDPDTEFQFVIQVSARSEIGRRLLRRLALTVRPPDYPARRAHRRRSAVVCNRHVFVVRHQRILRSTDGARGVGVMDAGEEIGEVADPCGKVQNATIGVMHQPPRDGLDFPAIGSLGVQDLAHTAPQCLPSGGAGFQQRVQSPPTGCFRSIPC
jgi:hypothetical protein